MWRLFKYKKRTALQYSVIVWLCPLKMIYIETFIPGVLEYDFTIS